MLARLCRCLYGELPPDKLLQALTFSLLLCFVVGIYWLMRSLKDSVFATIVGLEHQPHREVPHQPTAQLLVAQRPAARNTRALL